MKKAAGPIIAIVIFSLMLVGGFFLGKNISIYYNEKNNTNKNIFQILKIVQEDVPINYVLKDGPKSIKELCGKDTGMCNKEVGRIQLNNAEQKLYVYSNFDNPDEQANVYFKINDKKIGSFVYLDEFAIFNDEYLLVSEPNSSDSNYVIHVYDYSGKEVTSFDATNINNKFEIINNELYFYNCNPLETLETDGVLLPKITKFKVKSDNIFMKIEESIEYKACS